MNKLLIIAAILLTHHLTTFAVGDDSLKAMAILTHVQDNARLLKTISYTSAYRQVNSEVDDSIFAAQGTIWLNRLGADTIFGASFHIKGADGNGPFDYYYDGEKSYELRHKTKELTIIYPANFDNTPNNPAKARTAMLPFLTVLTDTGLIATITKAHPSIKLEGTGSDWIITLGYILDGNNSHSTRQFVVDKQTYLVKKVSYHSLWNGTNYSSQYIISNAVVNQGINTDSLALSTPPTGYTTTERKAPDRTEDTTYRYFTGKKAPLFSYAALTGENIKLSALKGKYVLLDFWESWCGYCILAIPKIEELYNAYHSRGLTVLGITTENLAQIKKIVARNTLSYPTLAGNNKILTDYRVDGRPTYVLIGPDGKIITYSTGDLDKIKADLAKLLP